MILTKINNKNLITTIDLQKYFYLFAIFCAVLFITSYAFASSASDFETKFCIIKRMIKGPIGTSICTIAIAAAGAGFLGGKMDWKTLAILIGGVLTIFFSPNLIDTISDSTQSGQCPL